MTGLSPLPLPPSRQAEVDRLRDRWFSKVNRDGPNGCWLWTGQKLKSGGYGAIGIGQRSFRAHRIGYELLVGPIPEGLQLDHLCRVTSCVNPDHLEPVTPAENTRRGMASELRTARAAALTHCRRGHALVDGNVSVLANGKRRCRACQRLRDRWSYQPQTATVARRGPMRLVVEPGSDADRLVCGHLVARPQRGRATRYRRCHHCHDLTTGGSA